MSLKVHCQHAKPQTPNLQNVRLYSHCGVDTISNPFYRVTPIPCSLKVAKAFGKNGELTTAVHKTPDHDL